MAWNSRKVLYVTKYQYKKISTQVRTYIVCSEGETMETTNVAPSKDEQQYVIKFKTRCVRCSRLQSISIKNLYPSEDVYCMYWRWNHGNDKCGTAQRWATIRNKVLMLKHTLPVEVYCRLCYVYSVSVVVILQTVQRWPEKFAERRTGIDNAAQSDRPSERIDETVHCVHTLLKDNHHDTIINLQVQLAAWYAHEASHYTIHMVLCECLQMWWCC